MSAILPLKPTSLLAYPGGSPGVDPAHPASGGLIFSGVPSGNNFIDLTTGAEGTVSGTSTAAIDALGPSVAASSTGAVIKFTGKPAIINTGLTLGVIVRGAYLSASFNTFICTSSTTGGGCFLDTHSSIVSLARASGTESLFTGIGGLTPFAPYFIAVSTDNLGYSVAVAKRLDNGKILSQVKIAALTPPVTSNGTVALGSATGGATDWDGNLFAAMYSTRILTVQELLKWSDDPWAFWYP